MFGEKLFTGVGYPTPVSIPEETTCLTLQVPANAAWWALVTGLLTTLEMDFQWRQFEGGIDRDSAATRWQQMVDDALEIAATTDTCGVVTIPTPFWDSGTNVDDDLAPSEQIWYGRVTDLDNPTTTFVEDAAIWGFAGLIAAAGLPAAAIAFTTVAPSFVVAIRRGDLGEVIRLYIDGDQAAEVDTSPETAGDIIRVTLAGDPDLSTHDIMIVNATA